MDVIGEPVRHVPVETLDMSSGHSCMVCLEEFTSTDEDRIPRVLTCGHTFCTGCLAQLVKRSSVTCPTCKVDTPLPAGGGQQLRLTILEQFQPESGKRQEIQALPKNFGLLDLLGSLTIATEPPSAAHKQEPPTERGAENDVKRHDFAWCSEHDEPMKVFCRDDRKLICIYCQIHGRHKGHDCALLSQVAGEKRVSLQQWITQLTNRQKELKASLDALKLRNEELARNEEFIQGAVDAHIKTIVEAFQQRKEELCRQVTEQVKAKQERLGKQERAVRHIYNLVDGAISDCRGSLQASDAELFNGTIGDATAASNRACQARCQLNPVDETNLDCQWSSTALLWDVLAEYGTIKEVGGDHVTTSEAPSVREQVLGQPVQQAVPPAVHNQEERSGDDSECRSWHLASPVSSFPSYHGADFMDLPSPINVSSSPSYHDANSDEEHGSPAVLHGAMLSHELAPLPAGQDVLFVQPLEAQHGRSDRCMLNRTGRSGSSGEEELLLDAAVDVAQPCAVESDFISSGVSPIMFADGVKPAHELDAAERSASGQTCLSSTYSSWNAISVAANAGQKPVLDNVCSGLASEVVAENMTQSDQSALLRPIPRYPVGYTPMLQLPQRQPEMRANQQPLPLIGPGLAEPAQPIRARGPLLSHSDDDDDDDDDEGFVARHAPPQVRAQSYMHFPAVSPRQQQNNPEQLKLPLGVQRISSTSSSSGKRQDLRLHRSSHLGTTQVRNIRKEHPRPLARQNTWAGGSLQVQRWQCNFCTLVNSGDAKVCIACAKTRGTRDSLEDPGPPNSIPCPKCTLLNDPDRRTECVACGSALLAEQAGDLIEAKGVGMPAPHDVNDEDFLEQLPRRRASFFQLSSRGRRRHV